MRKNSKSMDTGKNKKNASGKTHKANQAKYNHSKHPKIDFPIDFGLTSGLDLKAEFAKFGFEIDGLQERQFNIHSMRLMQYSTIMNLTKITEHEEIVKRHFLDSLVALKYINTKIDSETRVIDIGSGAGFPGLPIAIYTSCQMLLMDSLSKRVNFLNDVIESAEITNVEAMHFRAEHVSKSFENLYKNFDYCVFRAFSSISQIVQIAHLYINSGGKIILFKSQDIDEEIKDAKPVLDKYGLTIEQNALYPDAYAVNRRVLVIGRIN